jgi:hypothetical protein
VYAGLRVPSGVAAFLAGQSRQLERGPRSTLGRRAEDVALAVEVATRMIAQRDAQSVAKRLGDVAEEAAVAARQARDRDASERGLARLQVALIALDGSSKALTGLGALGADLGSVTASELRRIRRSRDAKELMHAEIAARHLAARLRRPKPSFSASQRGGVESGLSGASAGSGEASDAKDRFDELSQQLQELAQEHAQGIVDVTDALEEAEQAQDLDALKDEARRRSQAVRDAITGLPESGRRQRPNGTAAEASAALAREHAASMAENLEAVQLDRAAQSGKDALEALAEAERKAEPAGDDLDRAELSRARNEVRAQLAWAEQKLDELRRKTETSAKPQLEKSGGREGELAERARALRETGSEPRASLPPDATDALERAEDLMREATKELRAGRGEQGSALMMEAQRWLEQAQPGSTQEPDEGSDREAQGREGEDDGGHGMARHAPLPKDKGNRAAEDFRQRVLRGLSQAHGERLSPAIKRYAERLLQ